MSWYVLLALLKHSFSDDISEKRLLIDSGIFLRIEGGWLDCLCTYNGIFPSLVNGREGVFRFLPGSSRRLAPVLKCRRFLSFFQRYIVRDILLTELYRWLIEILSAILKSTRHGGQSRERL